ncbi:C4-dicarboxylate ABC transporter [Pseudonocardia alni]|uniref:SLAC1 family transporter n=1 Tax=Pseudonocardia alni TaxID=33907 RepID=UPI0027A78375|nr:C4-dicarboxylate ABC transporter [Pseudonocardia alni]
MITSRLEQAGPPWFGAVMGTGIVAVATTSFPVPVPGLRLVGTVLWLLAAALLVALGVLVVRAGAARRRRGDRPDPSDLPFLGAPGLGMLTVGAGAVELGPGLFGEPAAAALSWTLWSSGTVVVLVVAVWVPFRWISRPGSATDPAPAWIMPVVGPMVAAADGALLIGHTSGPAAASTMLLVCVALFGLGVVSALALLPRVLARLGTAGLALADTPTVVIVLGPFGQSVTAANLLAGQAQGLLPEPFAGVAIGAGLLYGAPAWGFAVGWTVLSAVLIDHALRRGMPFSASWWAVTFPFGTLVTGTNALAARTALPSVVGAAVVLFAVLVLVWVVVAAATVLSALSDVADEIGPARRSVRA